MPGQLIHTNEIIVLLGDNWFAERSAIQATEIAKRRLKCKSIVPCQQNSLVSIIEGFKPFIYKSNFQALYVLL